MKNHQNTKFRSRIFQTKSRQTFCFVNIWIIAWDFEGKVNRENVSRFYGRRKPCFVFQLEPKSFRSRLRLLYLKRLNWIRFCWSLFFNIRFFPPPPLLHNKSVGNNVGRSQRDCSQGALEDQEGVAPIDKPRWLGGGGHIQFSLSLSAFRYYYIERWRYFFVLLLLLQALNYSQWFIRFRLLAEPFLIKRKKTAQTRWLGFFLLYRERISIGWWHSNGRSVAPRNPKGIDFPTTLQVVVQSRWLSPLFQKETTL